MNTLGIDFGTTNSAVAVYLEKEKRVVTSDYEGTLLYFQDEAHHFTGQQAIEKFLANGMKGRFIRSLKSILHSDAFKFTHIYDKKYFAEDLVALILTQLRKTGQQISGDACEKVVLGRPARFSPDPLKDKLAQTRLLKAAQKAGFTEITFQLEPIAAAFSYESTLHHPELVLVGDFGGGTADFTLMQLGPDKNSNRDRMSDILGSTGIRVGGDDFDAAIAWHKIVKHLGMGLEYDANGLGKMLTIPPHNYHKFCRWENHFMLNSVNTIREIESFLKPAHYNKMLLDFLQIIRENLGYALFRAIENAKIELSENPSAKISFRQSGIKIVEKITLQEFSDIIQPQLDKISETVQKLLSDHGFPPEKIDSVFLTGGTSLAVPVRKIFTDLFGPDKIREKDAFQSVAEGLALTGKER
ncbi:MAG: Hsp70 family protein [Bacteroidia bacterium]|nr:Hsp70 family protein [Bacteroidia bacterium]